MGVGDLERYIRNDVVRHGDRLSELEKLDNGYQEIVSPIQSCLSRSLAHDLKDERRRCYRRRRGGG